MIFLQALLVLFGMVLGAFAGFGAGAMFFFGNYWVSEDLVFSAIGLGAIIGGALVVFLL